MSGQKLLKALVAAGLFIPIALKTPALAGEAARPTLVGVAHIAVYVKDLAKTRQFYEQFLGFGEAFTVPEPNGTIVYVKVDDHQYIQLFTEPDRGEGQLNNIGFYTANANGMYTYLKSKGVEMMSNSVGKDEAGNKSFKIKDPDGHIVEVVEYLPDSLTGRATGKFMPPTRIAEHFLHVGVWITDFDKSMHFYFNLLGFKELWRGSSPRMGTVTWMNMVLADEKRGYMEFQFYDKIPEPSAFGAANHVCLVVPDCSKTMTELWKRRTKGLYTPPAGLPAAQGQMSMIIGPNNRHILNVYDPDGTRVEIMEPDTVDGKPASSTTAPVPHPTSRQ